MGSVKEGHCLDFPNLLIVCSIFSVRRCDSLVTKVLVLCNISLDISIILIVLLIITVYVGYNYSYTFNDELGIYNSL